MIHKTGYYSFRTGTLAKGCKLCVKGRKSVLFATGLCPRNCFYCPISEHKKNKDVIFINELNIGELDLKALIKEIRVSASKGVGITGGDPLSRLSRTIGFIKTLKETFGSGFHIHLYTSFDLVNHNTMKKLFDAGLDEIRFHPDLDDKNFWERIDFAKEFSWDVGIEVPVIPEKEKELVEVIEFFKNKVKFFNFNEFEVSDNNIDYFLKNYTIKENSYAVKGSIELGLRLLKLCDKYRLNCHLCSVKLKDAVQLAKRIKLRSKYARLKTDKLDSEGMLIRGVIYLNILPQRNYEEELRKMSPSEIKQEVEDLIKLKNNLVKEFKINENKLFIDKKKLRIITSVSLVKKLNKHIKNPCAIVKEYPTADQLTLELEFLE